MIYSLKDKTYIMQTTNFKFGEVFRLAEQVERNSENVTFKGVVNNAAGGVVLVAFSEGQALTTHLAPAELMVNVLEGEIEFTMNDKPHTMAAGDFMLVGKDVPHSVLAKTDAKLMLVKLNI